MRETREVQIGDCKYRMKSLGAKSAVRVLHVLSKATAPIMSQAQGLDMDVGVGFSEVLERLSPSDLDFVLDTLAKETLVVERPDGGGVSLTLSDIFDDHFTGKRLKDLFKWGAESLKFNFADFLAEIGANFQGGES
jgi:hypothetical protein